MGRAVAKPAAWAVEWGAAVVTNTRALQNQWLEGVRSNPITPEHQANSLPQKSHSFGTTSSHLKVKAVYWTSDDFHLVSCGQDGAAYEYDILKEGRRVSETGWKDGGAPLVGDVYGAEVF